MTMINGRSSNSAPRTAIPVPIWVRMLSDARRSAAELEAGILRTSTGTSTPPHVTVNCWPEGSDDPPPRLAASTSSSRAATRWR